jgi:glycosyltransferase involved in cell wall biosynthesis
MAMGLPTVAFDNPVNREMLGPCGTFTPDNDAQRFADAVCYLLDNPDIARSLGTGLRARACERFSAKIRGEQLMGIYNEVIKKKRSK